MDAPREHLIVALDGALHAVPVAVLRECHPLPLLAAARGPEDVVGIATVRGEAVPVLRPGRAHVVPMLSDVVVILQTQQGPVGLVVDEVREIRRLRIGRRLHLADESPIPEVDADALWRHATREAPARDAWTPSTAHERLLFTTRAQTLAAAPAPATPGSVAMAFVELSGARFALPLAEVRAFVDATHAAPLPGAPDFVRGDVNLRGEIVTVFDARAAMKLPRGASAPNKAIVVDSGDVRAGLLVDRVLDIAHVDPARLAPAPADKPHLRGLVEHEGVEAGMWDIDALLQSDALVVEEVER